MGGMEVVWFDSEDYFIEKQIKIKFKRYTIKYKYCQMLTLVNYYHIMLIFDLFWSMNYVNNSVLKLS